MAQLDHNIYFQQKPLDVMGSLEKGIRVRDLFDQQRAKRKELEEQEELRKAFSQTVGEDGSIDIPRTATELVRAGKISPDKYMALQKDSASLAHSKAQADAQRLAANRDRLGFVGQTLASATDQQSYERALGALQNAGVDISGLPPQFGPHAQQYAGMALTAKDRLDQEFRQRQLGQKDQEIAIERQKLAQKKAGAGGATAGQKKVDQEFAKDFNEWTSGGRDVALSEINKLRNVANRLRNKEVTTGGLTGMFPDRITSEEVLSARADVQSTVMNSLRAILGAQFTEKEGERIIKNTWNEADTTENNLARIERLVSDLEAKARAKEAKAQYFSERGTLTDFRTQPMQQAGGASGGWGGQAGGQKIRAKTHEIEWAD